jgi:hypothetical protein
MRQHSFELRTKASKTPGQHCGLRRAVEINAAGGRWGAVGGKAWLEERGRAMHGFTFQSSHCKSLGETEGMVL